MKKTKKTIRVGDTVYYICPDGSIESMTVMDIDGQTLYDSSFDSISKNDILSEDDPRVLMYKRGISDE